MVKCGKHTAMIYALMAPRREGSAEELNLQLHERRATVIGILWPREPGLARGTWMKPFEGLTG